MKSQPIIDVVIPALNEEAAIGHVLDALPWDSIRAVVVGDNGSADRTAEVARAHGAIVVAAPMRGYGAACLRAIEEIETFDPPCDILAFVDGDFSDYPSQLADVLKPILDGDADLVIGSRALGNAARGSLTLPQRWGNNLAAFLIGVLYKLKVTDLGPMRAIKKSAYDQLDMCDTNYGWTVEMQVKAARHTLRYMEVPVDYKERIGTSKVSGTVRGVFGAGYKILWTIAKYAIS